MEKIIIERLGPQATFPTKTFATDSGYDLFGTSEVLLKAGQRALVGVGLRMSLPKGISAEIRPRSGLALKHGITVLNSPGTIDSGFNGELSVILINLGSEDYLFKTNEGIAQLVLTKTLDCMLEEGKVFGKTLRGDLGFGSGG